MPRISSMLENAQIKKILDDIAELRERNVCDVADMDGIDVNVTAPENGTAQSEKVDALWRFCELVRLAERQGIGFRFGEVEFESEGETPIDVTAHFKVKKEHFKKFVQLPWGEKVYMVRMTVSNNENTKGISGPVIQ